MDRVWSENTWNTFREKEDEIKKLDNKLMLYKEETDMEIEKFKTKTEEQSSKIFNDLTKQVCYYYSILRDKLKFL